MTKPIMTRTAVNEALNLLQQFNQSPLQQFESYWQAKGRQKHAIRVSEQDQASLVADTPIAIQEAACLLAKNLDAKNHEVMRSLQRSLPAGLDTRYHIKPIQKVGVYIPYRLPSSVFTFLSAARAAGVGNCTVYLAEGQHGEPDPLSVYCARMYGADILCGPARYAFPTLALGLAPLDIAPVDLLCGPCSNSLNTLKQLSGIIGGVTTDMWAGSSELAVVVDETSDFHQISKDVIAQLEHGPESLAHVVVFGASAMPSVTKLFNALPECWKPAVNLHGPYETVLQAATKVNQIAPETAELWNADPVGTEALLSTCGVVYARNASSLGDYGVIGRGCADPTGGQARAQSGLSPMMFLRYQTFVNQHETSSLLLQSGLQLADYEQLIAHKAAMQG
jgi:histidinol dehydrogenase